MATIRGSETWDEDVWDAYERWAQRAIHKKLSQPGYWVEAYRIRAVLEQWLERFEKEHNGGWRGDCVTNSNKAAGPRDTLSHRSGVPARTICKMLESETAMAPRRGRPGFEGGELYFSLEMVDRLFCGMECTHLFYKQPTNEDKTDGFADVYFHASIIEQAA